MNIDISLFLVGVLGEGVILVLLVYFVITLADLECDYLNATSCCDKLNFWVLPELVGHGVLTFLMLMTGHWVLFLLYTPLTGWLVYRFVMKPTGNIGLYDPAEIHNRHHLKTYMRYNVIKLGVHLVFFFMYLYWMIYSLLSSSI